MNKIDDEKDLLQKQFNGLTKTINSLSEISEHKRACITGVLSNNALVKDPLYLSSMAYKKWKLSKEHEMSAAKLKHAKKKAKSLGFQLKKLMPNKKKG